MSDLSEEQGSDDQGPPAESEEGLDSKDGGSPNNGGVEDQKESDGTEPSGGVNVKVEEASGSHIETSENKWESCQFFFNGASGDVSKNRDLCARDFEESLSRRQLQRLIDNLVVPGEVRGRILRRMEAVRIVFIVGERGLGKAALAQSVTAHLAERHTSLQGVSQASGVHRSLRVRWDKLLVKEEGLHHKVLLFEDAFEKGNRDLARFVQGLDRSKLEAITRKLETCDSYVIFTADMESFPGKVDALESLDVLSLMEPPSPASLEQLLRKRILQQQTEADEAEPADLLGTLEQLLAEKGEWLLANLRTVPRGVQFVDWHLEAVARGKLSIEDALERLDNLEYWLLSELPKDPPVWAFVVALILASSSSPEPVSWFAFHRLWREVEAMLDEELGRDEEEPRPLTRLVVDSAFLTRARAEVRHQPFPVGEVVQFADPTLPPRLWSVLLQGGRALLTAMEPRLRTLVEKQDPASGVLAAQALGRMGDLDPSNLMLSRIVKWLRKEPLGYQHALLLGEMLVGASQSGDPRYLAGCFDQLMTAVRSEDQTSVENALVAVVPPGRDRLDFVMDFLHSALRVRIAKEVKALKPLAPKVQEPLDKLIASKSKETTDPFVRITPREAEGAALGLLKDSSRELLGALRFALVGLCFQGDALAVLKIIGGWLRSGPTTLAPWLALVLLREKGTLSTLEQYPTPLAPDEGQDAPTGRKAVCSQILLEVDDDEKVQELARFLEAAHSACAPFPVLVRTWLESNLIGLLDRWLHQASRSTFVRPKVVALLCALLEVKDDILRDRVFKMLKGKSGDKKAAGERNLALEILRRSGPGGLPLRLQ